MAEILDIKIGERIVNKMRLADDTAIIAKPQRKTTIYGE